MTVPWKICIRCGQRYLYANECFACAAPTPTTRHFKQVREYEVEKWVALGWIDDGLRERIPSIKPALALLEWTNGGTPPTPTTTEDA